MLSSKTPPEQEHVFGAMADPKDPKYRKNETWQTGGIKVNAEPEKPQKSESVQNPSANTLEAPATTEGQTSQRPLFLGGKSEIPETIHHPDNKNENWKTEYISSNSDLIDQPVLLSNDTKKHIDIGGDDKKHPTPLDLVRKTVSDPDVIHENIKSDGKKAYFLVKENAVHPTTKKPMRVVVKTTSGPDKHVVSTAYGTSKKPKGKILWQKK